MKRIISLLLLMTLFLSLCAPAFADVGYMYVYTDDGKRLNLREAPKSGSKILYRIDFGSELWVISISNSWAEVNFGGLFGYVQSRFLVHEKPSAASQKQAQQKSEQQKALDDLNRELKTLQPLSQTLTLSVRPTRASGWVNFRVGPGTGASRIATYGEGKQLIAVGETNKWYQAQDPESGRTGFISKNYVTVLPSTTFVFAPAANEKESLGKLNVNGEFSLECRLPEGYTLQVVNMLGSKIIASINPTEAGKPVLYLSIAYNDLYAEVARMNDLDADALAVLEQSFTEMNVVDISYRETAHGTKLLVAREVGSDTDFVDILTVYKGYSIEFVMTPNPSAASQTLTEDQIQMCVDFLSDLDFVEASV